MARYEGRGIEKNLTAIVLFGGTVVLGAILVKTGIENDKLPPGTIILPEDTIEIPSPVTNVKKAVAWCAMRPESYGTLEEASLIDDEHGRVFLTLPNAVACPPGAEVPVLRDLP